MLRKTPLLTVSDFTLKVIKNFPHKFVLLNLKKGFKIRVLPVIHISTPLIVLINLYI